jgi:hypothetical protein
MARMTWALVLGLVFCASQEAAAQFGSAAAMPGSPANGLMSAMNPNPMTNPLANPFLNPYLTQVPAQGNMSLYYFFAAQQASGGLGSGQLSGVRPGPGSAPGRGSAPAPTSKRRQSDVPGAVASRYFNRQTQPAGASGHYYNRQGRYYPANAH